MNDVAAEFAAHVAELLAPLGPVIVRRMFGGHGVYCDGLFIAIVHDEGLWLKTDAVTRERFVTAGGAPFSYERAGRTATLGFHAPPPEALESGADLLPWARLALAAALRAREGRPVSSRTTGRAARTPPATRGRSHAGSRRSRAPRRSSGSR